MKLEAKANFHNRFDIEVIRDGKVINRGQAENIVLDRAWERVCNFSSYFSQIHFGRGTGVLDPGRTTLFDKIGNKSTEDEEKVKAFPVSKVTRKITLMPEEFVGETITEVGISETSSYINTHALIKDAEGNPLAITKTDIDVVVIYATVFLSISTDNTNLVYLKENNLVDKLIDPYNIPFNNNIYVQQCPFLNKANNTISNSNTLQGKNGDIIVNSINREVKIKCRFDINEGNGEISRIQLGDSIAQHIPETSVFENFRLKDISIGVGDNGILEYYLPNRQASNLEIKISGIITNDYTIITEDTYYDLSAPKKRYSSFSVPKQFLLKINGIIIIGMSTYSYYGAPMNIAYIDPTDGATVITLTYDIPNELSTTEKVYYYISDDNSTLKFISSNNQTIYLKSDGSKVQIIEEPLNTVWTEISVDDRDEIVLEDYKQFSYNQKWHIQKLFPNAITKIIFNTPPPQGAVITADYTVPYIPKSEDYVLDVEFTLQFGEGV